MAAVKSINTMRQQAFKESDKQVRELFMKLNRMHIAHLSVKQRKALLRKAAKPVVKAAQAAAPRDTGQLKASIRVLAKMRDVSSVYVGPQYKSGPASKVKNAGNHAHFSEYGTRYWDSPYKGWFRNSVNSARPAALEELTRLVLAEWEKFKNRYGFAKRA